MQYSPLALVALAATAAHKVHALSGAGFQGAVFKSSSNGSATCVAGTVYVDVSGNNTRLLYPNPPNNTVVTETLVQICSIDPTIGSELDGGVSHISGRYGIYSELCIPKNSIHGVQPNTVQILTHGGTLDHTYWDLGPNNSYVDAAAAAGYATLAYDRLGIGQSDHPDPIQVVQLSFGTEVLHALVQMLRSGQLGGQQFKSFVGVGHSLGTGITQANTAKYPHDLDAVILTGTSLSNASSSAAVASLSMQIANTVPAARFAGLPNGYLSISQAEQAHQFAFFRFPYYDPQLFASLMNNSQTNTLGEFLTEAKVFIPAPAYTGFVDVVDGMYDYIYCGGDCTYPSNQAALYQPAIYPKASRGAQHYLVPQCGHVINAHYSAPLAFRQMLQFLKSNGIH